MLTLPADHTEADLELARLLAATLGASSLHVFWKGASGFQPDQRCEPDARK